MAERLCNMDGKKAAVPDGKDRLSALPDDVLLLILSYLYSREAVQTCVLSPRWRTLWKSAPSLVLNSSHSPNFINNMLRSRDQTPLRYCWINAQDSCFLDEYRRDAEHWLRYAISCKVRNLAFHMLVFGALPLSAGALASEHLTRLDLYRIKSESFSLDISSCQSLKELEVDQSVINIGNTGTDFPESLQLLIIKDSKFLPEGIRSSISAPGLVTLELVDCLDWTPFLKSMPSLETAIIRIGHGCLDSSDEHNICGVCGGRLCVQCYGTDDRVLLKSLSDATHLTLLSHSSLIFRREIKWRPMFSKLKTLLLCDWFVTDNFIGLVFFLQHSPVLEMLMLQLSNTSKKINMSNVYKPKNQFMVSKHLRSVDIKYWEEVGKIEEILNVLASHGVQPELINIESKPYKDCNYYEYYKPMSLKLLL
ncbi:putative FBD-associated F-box protein At5g56440 isoform X1 [Lolium rigidum]|uniref:putative FBD-associated F-box protein At5g56440 isoform X1 n=1 Tax=Lolium rigidum TaxID=89674 RepID=UPI001F5D94CD|nr:putative FBD-associated F-box protein At5g56440 isoform X1 [Lolium rigidum]